MNKAGKGRGKPHNPWRPLYWMPLLSIMICGGVAWLILGKKLPESTLNICPGIIGGIVSIIGSYRAARIAPRQKLLWGMILSLAYGIMLMLSNLFFFGESFQGVGEMFLWILGGGFLGAIFANMKKGKIA